MQAGSIEMCDGDRGRAGVPPAPPGWPCPGGENRDATVFLESSRPTTPANSTQGSESR